MRTFSIASIFVVLAACAATYYRYESFDPCVWMEKDMAKYSDMPRIAVKAQIRAEFLMEGITNPDPVQCLTAWWGVRAKETEGQGS